MTTSRWISMAVVMLSFAAATPAPAADDGLIDQLVFGEPESETTHQLDAQRSESIKGGLGEPARRLLPLESQTWEGGRVSFTLAVDPEKRNYFTVRLSGSDVSPNYLILYIEGKQVGYRHLGDVDVLDFGSKEPGYNGRFFYRTTPLPIELTRGKTRLSFEIRSTGPIWGYGRDFQQYQKPMTEPTRGIYRVYIHTDGFFLPPAGEKQGAPPADAPARKAPGREVLDLVAERVNREIEARLNSKTPISQMQMQLLARAYDVEWTKAYRNPTTIEQLVKGLDALFVAYRKDPRLAQAEPSTWNPDWFGLGVCGQVIALRRAELKPYLDQIIDDGKGGSIARRAGFVEMLIATRDWHRQHRRQYTNQSMLNDLNGIYHANRGIAVLDRAKALPEPEARRYLYESVGLEPWRDNDPGGRQWGVGESYMQLTDKGLTRELGYVGSYGEVLDLVADIYEATRPAPGEEGDARIKAQLVKIARARAAFRYPMLDAEGNRVMRLEQVVGWRDMLYPGYVVYGQRATRDASALQAAAVTLDPHLVGYAQQMIADNQFFASEVEAMNDRAQPLRTTIGRLDTPQQFELIKAQPTSPHRLPMTWGAPDDESSGPRQGDFVFSDEEDGVVALKHGEEILYASLYWRARNAVNFLGRVHFITPTIDRIAVVGQETLFDDSGLRYTRPDWTNFGFGNGGPRYPGDHHSAHAGEKLPIANIADGVKFKPGDENVNAGRGTFYTLRYGPYLIAMNMTADRTFELKVPAEMKGAKELVGGKTIASTALLKVAPRSTVVLRQVNVK